MFSVTSRRQPDQSLSRTRQGARDHPPDEGESEPAISLRISLAANPGQLSPGRPELLTSPVERCRGRPSRTSRAGRARLHYVEREDPGDGHPQPSAEHHRAARNFRMPKPGLQARGLTAADASQHLPKQKPSKNPVPQSAHQYSRRRLTDFFLRWLANPLLADPHPGLRFSRCCLCAPARNPSPWPTQRVRAAPSGADRLQTIGAHESTGRLTSMVAVIRARQWVIDPMHIPFFRHAASWSRTRGAAGRLSAVPANAGRRR
jgi:hypothetical protein